MGDDLEGWGGGGWAMLKHYQLLDQADGKMQP